MKLAKSSIAFPMAAQADLESNDSFREEHEKLPEWVVSIRRSISFGDAEAARTLLERHHNDSTVPYLTQLVLAAFAGSKPAEMLDLLESHSIEWWRAGRFDKGPQGDWLLQWAFDWIIMSQGMLDGRNAYADTSG
jgi:hypothetical protein